MLLKTNKESKIFILLGFVVFFLVTREALLIPLTHDEYSTIMVSYQSLFDIITYKDPIPNNHILNTLLLKLNIITFGDHLFSNRLHNILSFIPFYVFTILIAKKITDNFLVQLSFICMVILQPFLLDFFSVTRGYGLSVSFQMISLYFGVRYIKYYSSKDLYFSIIFGAIGVIANFTLLNFYIPITILLIFFSFRFQFKNNYQKFKIEILITSAITIILGLLCFLPFKKMVSTQQFVFWSSNNFFNDTVVQLFQSLRVGVFYFKWDSIMYAYVFLGLLAVLLITIFILFGKKIVKNPLLEFSGLLLILVLIYNNLQFYIANVPFLNARTSLFFVPLVALFIFVLFTIIQEYSIKATKTISVFIILFCTQHFVRGYNGRSNYEWYFNQNTYDVLDEIMYNINSKNLVKPVLLDCHWYYHPSLTYHINKKYRGIIELVPYHKETNVNSGASFYYSEPNESDILAIKFNKLKEFGDNQSFLWMKK